MLGVGRSSLRLLRWTGLVHASKKKLVIFSGARKDCVAARLLRIMNSPFGLSDGGFMINI